MKISQILTKRNTSVYNPKVYQATQILYEWEDILANELDANIVDTISQNNSLAIEMSVQSSRRKLNSSKVIPWIVDFYISSKIRLFVFYLSYCFNKVVLVSSKEVYDFLKQHHCPLRIKHLALSLPDQYRITPDVKYEKDIDCALIGRLSPVLHKYAMEYSKSHRDFVYVSQNRVGTDCVILDQNNNTICLINERNDYFSLLKRTRVMLYSTPSMDGEGANRSHGFNQVTPKFLEYISCGCHIIGRFPKNSDVEYYELDRMCLANVDNYDDFERAMDTARTTSVDMPKYSAYLSNHYTSVRVKELKNM